MQDLTPTLFIFGSSQCASYFPGASSKELHWPVMTGQQIVFRPVLGTEKTCKRCLSLLLSSLLFCQYLLCVYINSLHSSRLYCTLFYISSTDVRRLRLSKCFIIQTLAHLSPPQLYIKFGTRSVKAKTFKSTTDQLSHAHCLSRGLRPRSVMYCS